ncbi:hypothetical protein V7150_17310 [Neobacillus drentensis]|uniref:hypothetical protein n=1 Tax=Neobacillus drentensis TaxID=220684 RepID=UPI002FFF7699
MADNNYDKRQKKENEGKKEVDDKLVLPGCVDLFILPLQICIAGYSLFNII